MKTKKKKSIKKLNARNSKILHDTIVTLGALKEGSDALKEMAINEIQVHLLDDSGDGVIFSLEYETSETGELKKTFSSVDEYYEEVEDGVELDAPHYYGEDHNELDPCISPENMKEFLKAKIEETISEEYDEIFHDNDDDKPPLLN